MLFCSYTERSMIAFSVESEGDRFSVIVENKER
jgi:hypothetical protein